MKGKTENKPTVWKYLLAAVMAAALIAIFVPGLGVEGEAADTWQKQIGRVSLKALSGSSEADEDLSVVKLELSGDTLGITINAYSTSISISNQKVASVITATGSESSSRCTWKLNIKSVGKTTIKFRSYDDNSTDSVMREYQLTVYPAKTTLSSVTSPSKGKIKISWKKNTSGAGYQIYCSQSKSFKKKTTAYKVSGNSKSSATLTGQKSNVKYYIKVRSYKIVSGKTYYGEWSKVKTVKVK